jgi:hypothetical protein
VGGTVRATNVGGRAIRSQLAREYIEQRIAEERKTMSNRRRLFIGLGAAAAIVVIVGAVVLLRDDDKQSVNVVPAASDSTTTTTTSTTVPAAVVPHVWPLGPTHSQHRSKRRAASPSNTSA